MPNKEILDGKGLRRAESGGKGLSARVVTGGFDISRIGTPSVGSGAEGYDVQLSVTPLRRVVERIATPEQIDIEAAGRGGIRDS